MATFVAGLSTNMIHLGISLIAEVGGSMELNTFGSDYWSYMSGAGETYHPITFEGTDITAKNGHITSMLYKDLWTTETPGDTWFSLDASFSLKSFLKVSRTASVADDHSFLANILKGDDLIYGSQYNDVLDGFKGKDQLQGGDGKDQFVFDTALNANNVDTITDFIHADDTIDIDHSVFKDMKTGKLAKGDFTIISSAKSHAGVDGTDRILYDEKHGDLYFDRDGSHTGYDRILFAHVDPGTMIDHTDFHIL